MMQAMMTWQQCSDENNEDNDANYVHDGGDSSNEDIQMTLMVLTTVAMMIENVTVCCSWGKKDRQNVG